MVQNDNKTYYHLDNLGGLRPERVQTGTKTDCLVHLSGIGSEIMAKIIPKLTIWSIWAALEPKWSKNNQTCHLKHLCGLGTGILQKEPKLTIWSI